MKMSFGVENTKPLWSPVIYGDINNPSVGNLMETPIVSGRAIVNFNGEYITATQYWFSYEDWIDAGGSDQIQKIKVEWDNACKIFDNSMKAYELKMHVK